MAVECVDTPDTTVHLGIVRNTNGRADIDGKISLGRKTAYSLMVAGLHGGDGLKATLVSTSGLPLSSHGYYMALKHYSSNRKILIA